MAFVPGDIFHDESLLGLENEALDPDAMTASPQVVGTNWKSVEKLLQVYKQTNQWDRIESAWKSFFGDDLQKANLPAYAWLFRSFAERRGKSVEADAHFERLKSEKGLLSADLYTCMMLSSSRDGRASRVLELFEEMKTDMEKRRWSDLAVRRAMQALYSTPIQVEKFVESVTLCLRCGSTSMSVHQVWKNKRSSVDTHKAEDIAIEAKKRTKSLELEMYGFAMMKCLTHGDHAAAQKYAELIVDSKEPLYARTISHVAHYYMQKGQLSEARKFLNHSMMRDSTTELFPLNRAHRQIPPRLAILLLLLPLMEASTIESKKKTAIALLPQFYDLFATYEPQNALAISKFMTKQLFKHQCFTELFELIEYVERALGSSISLTSILNMKLQAYVALNRTEEALHALAKMQADTLHSPDSATSVSLISMAAKMHGPEEARELLNSIIESVGVPNASAFRVVVDAFCKFSRVDDALQVLSLQQTHGFTLDWDDYLPIMQVYERKNLLGKQFSLFNWLLTQRLSDRPPSALLTSKLISASVRQRYFNVAQSVVQQIDKLQTQMSPQLLTSILLLYQSTGRTSDITSLALLATDKVANATSDSAMQRTKFAIVAMRAYSILNQPKKALEVFEIVKKELLPLNIRLLSAVASAYIDLKQKSIAAEYLGVKTPKDGSPSRLESEFGVTIAEQTRSNSAIAALKLKLLSADEMPIPALIQYWNDLMANEQRIKDANNSPNIDGTVMEEDQIEKISNEFSVSPSDVEGILPDTHTKAIEEEVKDSIIPTDEYWSSEISKEAASLSEESKVSDIGDDLVKLSQQAETEEMAISSAQEEEEKIRVQKNLTPAMPHRWLGARISLSLCIGLLLSSYKRLKSCLPRSKENREIAKLIVQISSDMTSIGILPTMEQHSLHICALMHLNMPVELKQKLEQIYSLDFNLPRTFYHSILHELSCIRGSKKTMMARMVIDFMEAKKSDRSPNPDITTYTLYLTTANPADYGKELKYFIERASKLPNFAFGQATLESLARSMILSMRPLYVAVHDTFVLLDHFESHHKVYPSSTTLTTLFTACMRPIVPPFYKHKFVHYIHRLHSIATHSATKLNWNAPVLQWAFEEASSVSQDPSKRVSKLPKKLEALSESMKTPERSGKHSIADANASHTEIISHPENSFQVRSKILQKFLALKFSDAPVKRELRGHLASFTTKFVPVSSVSGINTSYQEPLRPVRINLRVSEPKPRSSRRLSEQDYDEDEEFDEMDDMDENYVPPRVDKLRRLKEIEAKMKLLSSGGGSSREQASRTPTPQSKQLTRKQLIAKALRKFGPSM